MIEINLHQNQDGSLDGRYKLGDKPYTPPASADLVVDGFENYSTGNLTDPTTNTINFAWSGTNRTSVVTGGAGVNQVLHPTPSVVNDSRNWSGKEGNNALRFEYPAGVSQSEQRFTFEPRNEVWFRYWLRVPENYVHNSTQPSNCKLFALWCDGYSALGTGGSVIWEFWHSDSVETNGSQLAVHYAKGDGNGAGAHLQYQDFCTPSDSGRWMQIAMQCINSTSTNSDGEIRLWRRWDGDSSFTLLHELTDAIIPLANDGNGWRAGYLMGWANPTYAVDTEWLVDNFEIGSGSLI